MQAVQRARPVSRRRPPVVEQGDGAARQVAVDVAGHESAEPSFSTGRMTGILSVPSVDDSTYLLPCQ